MVKKWVKQIKKLPNEFDINSIILDIQNNNLAFYDIKKMSWYKYLYRLKKGKIRIVFEKNENIKILKIDNRWDIYKSF